MGRSIANILSYLLHPLAMPTLGALFFLDVIPFNVTSGLFYATVAIVFIGTYLLPGLSAVLMKQMGIIKSIKMETPEQRRGPFLVTGLYYVFVARMLIKFDTVITNQLFIFLMASAISIVLVLFLLPCTKLSIHMVGLGGLLGLVLGTSLDYELNLLPHLSTIFVVSGLVGTARLTLNAHKPTEIYLGYLVGFVFVFGGMYFFI